MVLEQKEDELKLPVENISPFIPSKQVAGFFQRGSSSKGKDRGIGLAKLQKMVEKSKGRIIAQNIEKEGQNWLLMQVVLPFQGGEINGHQNIHINTQKI